ncbi:MAG: hypothetical protein RIC55_25885 [Pirellulaceae bacterium]
MNTADLINGGISLAIGLFFVLVAAGVVPIAKKQEDNSEKLRKFGWMFWLAGIGAGILGLFKLFGVMR